jgi:fucose 4-O-acetylase-like acetyltransferase
MNDRIQYIDRLKGLAILLVVIGHLMAFCTNGERNPIYEVICSFHMPLFMFLSGLVLTYTPPIILQDIWGRRLYAFCCPCYG